jgi:hypothetical protein
MLKNIAVGTASLLKSTGEFRHSNKRSIRVDG